MSDYIALIDTAFTNKGTANAHKQRIRTMEDRLEAKMNTIVKDPETYYSKLQTAFPALNTRKNMLTTILVLFREDKRLAEEYVSARELWVKRHSDLNRSLDAKIGRSEPEDKQIAAYTSYEEIEKKYEELRRRGYHDTERHSMQYLLLSFLVHMKPKRADLGALQIFKERDPRRTDANYIVLRSKGTSYLVMNVYKTSKYYQTVEEDMPEGFVRDIEQSLARWPRDYVFRTDEGKPMTPNTYAVFVRSTFNDFFGRKTGVSMLRHIYISEKVNYEDMTLEEQAQTAKLMLHTSGLQRQYKWPKKTLCPKLCAAYITPTHRTRKIRRTKKKE